MIDLVGYTQQGKSCVKDLKLDTQFLKMQVMKKIRKMKIFFNYLLRNLLSNKTLKNTLKLPELNPSIDVRIKPFLKWLFSKVFEI